MGKDFFDMTNFNYIFLIFGSTVGQSVVCSYNHFRLVSILYNLQINFIPLTFSRTYLYEKLPFGTFPKYKSVSLFLFYSSWHYHLHWPQINGGMDDFIFGAFNSNILDDNS